MKTQTVRLLDVFFVGPWMVKAGMSLDDWVLIWLGIATVVYNGYWYLMYRNGGYADD